ncbi:4-hydroxyphenylacetate 3-monooxygenase, oxygenase component [Pseudemcibacter aquimaris]|uniref:4-hydroxyphenylacetate 3-monooxygenase, oxygenase component n=1 Tax=Pseudemcibacter aquimaris TaxID=2857064 RepID=UPI002011DE09|nr:4-hydroxyphenylacetate 3-monooxygenase, oxygenase component [Pseudemcibacter aquimaris]MCC3860198.1 4-hydroxyphenylacetate 3-monooxygenase, oxygenase component [Pseudemcibacter aquimaris]WDU57523.1 4-hydroxyphenylacetate 3-monooxygenase, oxygenase component [Pseudemcibacter aquimaris]
MAIRSGKDYLEAISKPRDIRIDGEKVTNVVTDPRFSCGAQTMAKIFDLQCREDMLDKMTYVENGERYGLSHKMPQSKDDLKARMDMFKIWSDFSCGTFGRSPDYMNVYLMAMYAAADEFGEYADNVRGYYKYIRDNDLSMTHTLINPQVDRSKPVEQQDKDLAAKIVETNDEGIVIKGARMVSTLSAYADEILVVPSGIIQNNQEAKDYAFAFGIQTDAPGVIHISRPSVIHQNEGHKMDYPMSGRFDETDAMIIFDNVLVPWERVFTHGDVTMCNEFYKRTNIGAHILDQSTVRSLAKAEFYRDLAFTIADSTKTDGFINVQNMLAELMTSVEMVRSIIVAAHAEAKETHGIWAPNPAPYAALRLRYPDMYQRMCEIIRILGAGGLVAVPSYAEFDSDTAKYVEKYFQSANGSSRERTKLFRLAADASMSTFAGRQQLYERYYSGDPVRAAAIMYNNADKEPNKKRIWEFLDEYEKSL